MEREERGGWTRRQRDREAEGSGREGEELVKLPLLRVLMRPRPPVELLTDHVFTTESAETVILLLSTCLNDF